MTITHSECVFVALVTQHAKHMCHIVIRGLLAVQYFPTLSHTRRDFRGEKNLLNTKCVFWFSLKSSYETFLIVGRIRDDFIIMWRVGLHVKCCSFLRNFYQT